MGSDDRLDTESLFGSESDSLQLWVNRTRSGGLFMPRRHRHNTVELNYIREGWVGYLLPGRFLRVPPRRFTVFWGATPHQIVEMARNTWLYSLHVPLAWFLDWNLPEDFTARVLRGAFAMEPDHRRAPFDGALFTQWASDLDLPGRPNDGLLLLELRARLHRLALSLDREVLWAHAGAHGAMPADLTKVETMARFVAENYTEDLSAEEVAEHVGLHPKYASQLFHGKCGITLKQYITMNRVHHAQLLLLTTDLNVLDVAMRAGFGSASRFYASFHSLCGQSPRDYRSAMRRRVP